MPASVRCASSPPAGRAFQRLPSEDPPSAWSRFPPNLSTCPRSLTVLRATAVGDTQGADDDGYYREPKKGLARGRSGGVDGIRGTGADPPPSGPSRSAGSTGVADQFASIAAV